MVGKRAYRSVSLLDDQAPLGGKQRALQDFEFVADHAFDGNFPIDEARQQLFLTDQIELEILLHHTCPRRIG